MLLPLFVSPEKCMWSSRNNDSLLTTYPQKLIVKQNILVAMTANDGAMSAVVLILWNRALVHRMYLPNNVGTHFQLSILKQIWVMKLPKLQKRSILGVGIDPTTGESRVQHANH